ncbi:recoverin isoform X1 [Piliocolobus tephrosceles]|uniref:recoverin isoform X1 n=1 Tax=Piliocolobus tephrosceles TaxID=591936 RepID=UPI000C29FE51|nr:recoverin isoform X1 [Piliocolobus tephrosceles]
MGNSKSGALSKEILEELQLNTKFSEEELCSWYQSFLKDCPSGRITQQQFQSIYAKFFPDTDPKAYAQHVFRSFDSNLDGTLDFKEYVIALHMTSAGKTNQKLEWAFSLYDVDGNGTISKNEVLEIVMCSLSVSIKSAVVDGNVLVLHIHSLLAYRLIQSNSQSCKLHSCLAQCSPRPSSDKEAIFKMITPEDVKLLPEDENTPEKRAEKIWKYFGKSDDDKLTEKEFIEGTLANKEILRLIQFEPQKVKEKIKNA